MDRNFPFTQYDFWAYLSAGFLLLYVLDFVIGTNHLTKDSWTVVEVVIAFSAAYAMGHLAAGVSALVLERGLVGKVLGWPRMVLFEKPKAWGWIRPVFLGYFEPLPPETQQAVLAKGGALGIEGPGEALFWPAHAYAKALPVANGRMQSFLNMYGFCRNTAMVSFLDAALLEGAYRWFDGPESNRWWAVVAVLLGIGMTLRYVKFLRLYAVEVFTTFAYSKES